MSPMSKQAYGQRMKDLVTRKAQEVRGGKGVKFNDIIITKKLDQATPILGK